MRECASSGWRSQMLIGPLHCACLHCTHSPSQLACIYLYITRSPPVQGSAVHACDTGTDKLQGGKCLSSGVSVQAPDLR